MLILLWLYFINAYLDTIGALHNVNTPLRGKDLESATIILNTTADIIHDSNERIASLYKAKLDNLRSAPFEVGYLVYTIQEKYRKMVDKYNTSHFMNTRLYLMELVMYLEEIEHHYWEIEHLNNMAHEIERKYMIKTDLNEDYRLEATKGITTSIPIVVPPNPYNKFTTKKKKFKWAKYIDNYKKSTTTKRPVGPFPFDYGWDVEGSAATTPLELEELLKELSWTLRLKLLNEMNVKTPQNMSFVSTVEGERRAEKPSPGSPTRRVGIEALVHIDDKDIKRRQTDDKAMPVPPEEITADENNMRLKLFRLMYETVRDSDLKVKRAELIQNHYTNMTAFQVGYLMGDVTDKYTVMTDISSTLERFYREWKPIEHINAYEQIANQAIEISHLIDLMRLASKRDDTSIIK